MQQTRRRIDRQRGAAHNQQVGCHDVAHCTLQQVAVQALFIQHYIRLDDPAAGAARNTLALVLQHLLERIGSAAADTVVAQHAAVQLVHPLAARLLVQSVDILGNDRRQLTLCFQLCQRIVRSIRLCLRIHHPVKIILKKLLGVPLKKAVAEHRFGRIGVGLCLLAAIQPILAAKIGHAGFGGAI